MVSRVIPASLALIAVSCGLAFAATTDLIEQREDLMMGTFNEANRIAGETVRGQRSFDADALASAVQSIAEGAARIPDLFAPGSEGGNALPAIWEGDNFADFTERAASLATLATAAAAATAEGETAFRAAFLEMSAVCSGCHELYRAALGPGGFAPPQ